MQQWIWVPLRVAYAAHDEQIRLHGGGAGVRDERLLESALARPLNLAAYGEPDAAELAASYAYGIARNHPFVDGNKRTALVVSITFLELNGYEPRIEQFDAAAAFEQVAAGHVSEAALANWFRDRLT